MYFDILMATDELVGTYEFYILFYPLHWSLLRELSVDLIRAITFIYFFITPENITLLLYSTPKYHNKSHLFRGLDLRGEMFVRSLISCMI